jgi:hypothetical protein
MRNDTKDCSANAQTKGNNRSLLFRFADRLYEKTLKIPANKKSVEFVGDVKVREMRDTDIIPLAEFLAEEYPFPIAKEGWLSMFDLWWASNPAYTEQFPKGWVIEDDTKYWGFLGNIPVKFIIQGKVKIAAAANSWYTDASLRCLFSLRLFNEFTEQKQVSLLLAKFELDSFFKIVSKFKFEHYVLPKSQKEYFYIIDKKKVKYIFFNFLLNGRIHKFSDLSELYKRLGFLISVYIHQKSVIQEAGQTREVYTSSVCTVCDDSFSRLWVPYLDACDTTLSRDTKTLNWLYFSPASSARLYKRIVIQCHRSCDKTLAGYMVFDVQRLKPSDEGRMQLIDGCIEDNDSQVLLTILSFAIEIGKQNGVALLELWANNQKTEMFLRNTFILRRTFRYHRFMKFIDTNTRYNGSDYHGNVCPTMIFPPQ